MVAVAVSLEERLDRGNQGSSARSQLADSLSSDLIQKPLPPGQERDQNLSAIFLAPLSPHIAVLFQSVKQLDGAVMLQSEPFRERADGSFGICRQSADRQQHEVLLGFEAREPRRRVSLPQKQPDAIAEFG